jgi:hypothetical protein
VGQLYVEEVDGEDGAAYLGNIGNATIAVGADEPNEDAGAGAGEADEADADAQLDLLLTERAARLGATEQAELGRGKRERRQVANNNIGGAVQVETA